MSRAQDAAPERDPWRVRASLTGGAAISPDQIDFFAFDLAVMGATLRVGWVPADWFSLQIGLGGGAFFSSSRGAGGLLDLTAGAEIGHREGIAFAWLGVHIGPGITGALVRPVMRIEGGVDLAITDEVGLGPAIGYTHVFEEDGNGRSDDAIVLSGAITLTIRPSMPSVTLAPPEETERPADPPVQATVDLPPPSPVERVDDEELMRMVEEAVDIEPQELLVPVLFDFDSATIVVCSIPALHALREHLESHPEIARLRIEGHADSSGDPEYNRELARRRAQAINDWLVQHGVAPERLEISSQGENDPIESNEEEAGRVQNRRARFLIVSLRDDEESER